MKPPVDRVGERRQPGLDDGDPSAWGQNAACLPKKSFRAREVVYEVERDDRIEGLCAERQAEAVGHEVVPRGLDDVRGQPGCFREAGAGVGREKAGSSTYFEYPALAGESGQKHLEPDRVDVGQHGFSRPDSAVFFEALAAQSARRPFFKP
jgi:hypothetical protein